MKIKSNFENIMKDIKKTEEIIDKMRLKQINSMFKFKLADYDNNKITFCYTKKELLKEFKKLISASEQITVGVITDNNKNSKKNKEDKEDKIFGYQEAWAEYKEY